MTNDEWRDLLDQHYAARERGDWYEVASIERAMRALNEELYGTESNNPEECT